MPPRKRKAPDPKKYELELTTHSFEELRKELQDLGENPGPIDASNKDIYVRMLARKKIKLDTEEHSPILLSSPPPSLVSPARTPPKAAVTFKPSSKAATPSHPKSYPSARVTATPRSSLKPTARLAATTIPQHISRFEVKGLVAATFTPFTDAGELNVPVIKKYADYLCHNGVYNVFVNGTTGEGLSLTVEERQLATEEWIKVGAGRMTVLVHVGTENLKNTCTLAAHAQEVGAAAIGVMPPSFFKPATIEHLILYLEQVAESAPRLPLFYYHIPSMSGTTFSMEEFLDAASTRLPTLRGLKFTSTDLFEFGRCVVHSGGKYHIIYGKDEQLIGALSLGGDAAIGSTYNFAGKLYNRLLTAFQKGDMQATKLEQRRSQAMVKCLLKFGGHAGAGKAFMMLQGMDMGPPRLPVLPLSPENLKSLEQDLKDIGFFNWA